MNKANHILSAACLSLALSLSSCTTESAESPPPPSSDSQGGLSSSVIEAQSSSSSLVPSSSSVLPSSGSGGGTSGTFTDGRDGQTYKTVEIGDQTWMAENLNYNASGSVCYDNSASNCDTYGRLYNWSTALSACPSGWHLPSDSEWDVLTDFVGSNAGTKLKATSGWAAYSGISNLDTYGFSAIPGGYGRSDGSFNNVGALGYWWSATELDASYAWNRDISYYNEYVFRNDNDKSHLFSARCLRD